MTCITATGRSGRFTTTRRSCSSPRINTRPYPGTGAATETGAGKGAGFTVNLPLDAGATDADYDVAFETVAFPVLRQFRPELILISAGFDALADDPLGGMRLSANQFARLTAALTAIADECCGGRVVAITEGGYSIAGFASCLRGVVPVLAGERTLTDFPSSKAHTPRGNATVEAALPNLRPYWTL